MPLCAASAGEGIEGRYGQQPYLVPMLRGVLMRVTAQALFVSQPVVSELSTFIRVGDTCVDERATHNQHGA